MKAPAGRPGLDVRRGGERAAARGPVRPSAPRPAAATCPSRRGLRAAGRRPRAIKGPAGGGEGAPGGRSAGRWAGASPTGLLINRRKGAIAPRVAMAEAGRQRARV
jgi:hypothetical protein